MAFSRRRKRGGEQGKGVGEMSSKPTSGLGGIVEMGLPDQRQDEIIDRSHDLACVPNRHAGGIFLEGDIAAIV